MTVSKPLISVIIPMYNVEEYISNCVSSIIHQTYTSLEIIIIDDGSTDSSFKICQELAKKDERIHLVHQENQGVSSARNRGIDLASGEFIFFIDADDFIHHDMIQILFDLLIMNNADIAMCDYLEVFDTNEYNFSRLTSESSSNNSEIITLSGRDAIMKLLGSYYVPYVIPCNKLYKKTLFSSVRFPIGKLHEDEYTLQEIFLHANMIIYEKVPLYFYVQRKTSITHEKNEDLALLMLQFLKSRADFCVKHNVYKAHASYWYLSRYKDYIWKFEKIHSENKTEIRELKQNYRKDAVHFIRYLDIKYFIKFCVRTSALWNIYMNR